MQKMSVRALASLVMIIAIILMLGPSIPSVSAQGGTPIEIRNGDFEGNFSNVNGDVTKQVADGWQPWDIREGGSADGSGAQYVKAREDRVRTGKGAQEYNTFFAVHHAGLLQQVIVPENAPVKFSAFIYVWSTSDLSNLDVSASPLGVTVEVGIDPTGGVDPRSNTIVWSGPQEYYDEYRENTVTATAQGDIITVFVRSQAEETEGVTAIYVDDASLLQVEGGAPGPTDTPTSAPVTRTDEPTTQAPSTQAVTTEAPTTQAPTTQAATTQAPTTQAPTTQAPTTQAPTTQAPTTQAPSATPTPTPQAPTVAPVTTVTPPVTTGFTYTVTFGDTLIGIAIRFNTTVDAIVQANNLPSAGLIYVNQQLTIPLPASAPGGGQGTGEMVYVVQYGDTLFSIARRYNTTVQALAAYNNIINPWRIFAGQQLRIPASTAVPPAPPDVPLPGVPTAAPIGQPSAPTIPTAIPVTGAPIPAPPLPPASGVVSYIAPNGALIHIVQPGDNVFRIGLRYGVTWDVIARANGLFYPQYIFPGQHLVIPRY
jgi:LysM repeat protein